MTPWEEAAQKKDALGKKKELTPWEEAQAAVAAQSQDTSRDPQYLTSPDSALRPAEDLAVGVATGLNKGAAALPGLPGDILGLLNKGTKWASGDKYNLDAIDNVLPTSQSMIDRWEGVSGKLPTPTTTLGQYGEAGGEFLPSMGRGAGIRGLTSAMAGGGAQKAVGDMTDNPWAAGAAGLLGTIIGKGRGADPIQQIVKDTAASGPVGRTGTRIANAAKAVTGMGVRKDPFEPAVSRAANLNKANDLYAELRASKTQFHPDSLEKATDNVLKNFDTKGITADNAPHTTKLIEKKMVDKVGTPPTFNDIETINQQAGIISREGSYTATDRAAASQVKKEIDDLYKTAPLDQSTLNQADIRPKILEARDKARREILSKQVDTMSNRAETYQSGSESGHRNQFGNFLRSGAVEYLTKAEKQAFEDINKGTDLRNALGTLGKAGVDLSKRGNRAIVGPLLSAYSAAQQGGLGAGLMSLLGGTVAKKAALKMSDEAVSRARKVIQAGPKQQATSIMKAARKNTQAPWAKSSALINAITYGNRGQQ